MSQGDTLYETEALEVHSCPSCGVLHAIPTSLERRALDDRGPNGRQIYCPNGHTWHFTGKTAAQKARDEAERLRQQLASARENTRAAEATAQVEANRARAYKGHATRVRRRAAKGLCPCCNEAFPDVAEHVRVEHPGFEVDELELRT